MPVAPQTGGSPVACSTSHALAFFVERVLGRTWRGVRLTEGVGSSIGADGVYTWYNVVGFWNPYDNTGNLRVCVVNEDAGASSELTGELHVGDMIVEELRENEQLDWAFVDRATAMDELDAGASYAAFVIPEDFTERLSWPTT